MCQKRKGQVHKIKMGGPLSEEKSKLKETVLGIVAHVDAGKTTLSENFLYFGMYALLKWADQKTWTGR